MMKKQLVFDDLWRRVEPLLPKKRKNRHVQYAGRKPWDDRKVFEGIVFALKTGIPWEFLPATEVWPSGMTCWRRLMKWHRAGVWKKLFASLLSELRAQGKLDLNRGVIDSASVRAPGGGRKTGPNPVDRRKLGSKHHLLTEAHGIPLSILLTGANRHDVSQLLKLAEAIPWIKGKPGHPRKRVKCLQGDRAYDSEPHRKALKKNRNSIPPGSKTNSAWKRFRKNTLGDRT
jgi:transposase